MKLMFFPSLCRNWLRLPTGWIYLYVIPNWKCVSSMPSHDPQRIEIWYAQRDSVAISEPLDDVERDERTNDSCNNCLSQLLLGWTSSASCKTVSVACAVGTRSETKQSSEKSEPNLECFFPSSSFICETFVRFHCVVWLFAICLRRGLNCMGSAKMKKKMYKSTQRNEKQII